MLISSVIPNLVNGVSQQPPTLRLASQAEDQINFLSSVAGGLTMRPPTRHLAKLSSENWSNAFLHTINRDTVEKYLLVIRSGQVRVFEAQTGLERTVNAPDGWGYLAGGGVRDFRAVTVADFTFILNRMVKATPDSALSPLRPNQALIQVRGGNYGKTYRVNINGTVRATFTTRDGSSADHIEDIKTTKISSSLTTTLQADTDLAGEGFTFVRRGDSITVNKTGTTPFTLRVEDDSGGTQMVAIQGQMQRFSDLPKQAPDGFVVEITGDQASQFDNYHVRFKAGAGASEATGVWEETIKGGEQFRVKRAEMPHILVREADGTFTFKQGTWEDREVGDTDKIPMPSFVDRPIRDIFFYRNRLGFVADENVIMSQAGEFFNFWRATATTVLDSDPIDIAVTNARVSILNYAIPFNKTLLLFSDQSQFIMEAGDVLTPSTVSITQATSFESAPNVRPVGVGPFIYFPVPRGSYSGMREYFVQEGGANQGALDVTSHVPRFLPSGLFQLTASTAEDTLVALSEETPNTLWVYKFFSTDEGKLQSSWSRWVLSSEDTILHVSFIDSTLFLVVRRDEGVFIETLDLSSGAADEDAEFLYRVDRGIFEAQTTVTFDAAQGTTTWTLPYATSVPLWVVVRAGDANGQEGLSLNHTRPSPTMVRVEGDYRDTKVVIGQKFTASYVFSTFHLRSEEPGGGVTANSDGRLQIRYIAVDYDRTGFFELITQARGRSPSVKTFSGRTLGILSGTVAGFNLATGRFRAPVMSRNVDATVTLRSDSFLPCSFTSAEWEATYNTRARKAQ